MSGAGRFFGAPIAGPIVAGTPEQGVPGDHMSAPAARARRGFGLLLASGLFLSGIGAGVTGGASSSSSSSLARADGGADGGADAGTRTERRILPMPPLPQPAPLGGPVPMFRGDAQHTGRSPFLMPTKPPTERWRFEVPARITAAAAVAQDGTVLFGAHDFSVYALRPDGTLRWRRATQDIVWGTPALGGEGGVFVGSDDDRLYSLNLSDGSQRWIASPGSCKRAGGRGPEGARCDLEQVTLGPDGSIYIGGDGISALKPDGTLRWRFVPERRIHCPGAPSIAPDGAVLAVCFDALIALNYDGSRRWEWFAPAELDSPPAVAPDGTAYLGCDDRKLYAIDPLGQVRFSLPTSGPVRAAVALGPPGAPTPGAPAGSLRPPRAVYFASYDGALYAARPDGTLLWSFRTADALHAAPLVDAAGNALIGSRDNRLYAVSAEGTALWSFSFDDDVDGTPALGPDGTIYVGADDRALHALR